MKLSPIALSAALLLAYALPASAAFIPSHPRTGGCLINCDQGDPGEPFIPPEGCMFNCDSADIPDPDKPKTQFADAECGDKLGHLRRVTLSQIESVGTDDLVDIIPVCRAKTLASEQEDVASLRPAIDENIVLDQELGQEGYNPEDVVGVIVDGQQVVLYVHRF